MALVLSQPLTWLAGAVVLALEIAFFGWFPVTAVPVAGALIAGLFCLALWPVIYLRSAEFTRRVHQQPANFMLSQEQRLAQLREDFTELDFEQGAAQLVQLESKFNNLAEVLKRRLNTTELTYGRYLGMAEQVYLASLESLHEVEVALRAVSEIDPAQLEVRLEGLTGKSRYSQDERRETAALRERQGLYERQQQRVTSLMAQNESAMTVLDKTAAALAQTKTDKPLSQMDAESAMAELELLAKRAARYATEE